MDLDRYLRVLRRGWRVILTLLVLGGLVGLGVTLTTTAVYRANVQVFVAAAGGGTNSDRNNGNTFVQERVQSYVSIATSPAVTGPVISGLGLRLTDQQLAARITADAPVDTVLINIHVTDEVPATARRLADAVAARFDAVVRSTEQTDADGTSVVRLTVIHPATVPTTPISPNRVRNLTLALVAGLLLGVAVVVVRDALDTTVRGAEDLRELDVTVFGTVPHDKHVSTRPVAFRDDGHSRRSEAYRQLRTNLQFVDVDDAPRIIAVTSAVPGEGKTTTAINLAAALAEGGFTVCLVEADLRRPTVARLLGVSPDTGFTTALLGRVTVADVVQNVGRNLSVLTSGPLPPNPSELLITDQAKNVITEVAATVDYTIIDTAPLLPVADGAEVAAMADATLLVLHAGHSTRDQVRRSVEALAKVGVTPVGAVLNRTRGGSDPADFVYRYAATDWPERLFAGSASDGREQVSEPEQTDATAGARSS